MASQRTSSTTEQRVIRVFVSSTFSDMQSERDYLVKFTFPQLRKLCESRAVTWGEVDLRWGITDEEKAEGKVLPLCLEEIRRCRPYFIGVLGERYGWVPDEIAQELIERELWLNEHLNHSVTELEILHGVLLDPKMADHAYFYFRDPSFTDSLPPGSRAAYAEVPTAEEIIKHGEQEAQRRAEARRQKLAKLKDRIRGSGLPLRENYHKPEQLGQWVLEDFTRLINDLFPEGEQPDALDRDAADHEAFAQSRARVYIGRQEYYDRLDEHARGDGPPRVVLGESGSGKSALLANWALKYRNSHPEELLLMHFIGATPYSTDWAAMLRRIMGEFKRHFGIEQDIPDQPDVLRSAFANWLHMVAARSKVVLILDALNQLEDRDSAPDLVWLPPEIPSNIRLIVSALPGRVLDDLNKRGWPTMQVKLLEADERKQLIPDYLAQYSKALSPARIARLAAAGQTANPLYLRALLDELRVFGIYEKLDDRIEHYLAAGTIPELYKRVLERYEEDYERDRAGLVRETMTLLWAARRGLSEAELLELLGTNQEPLPQAHWSPLYLAAEGSLVSRSGLIGFVHDYVRQAVEDKYASGEQRQQQAHVRLADYFESQYLGARKIDEMPWQLAEAKSWQRLCDLLADRQFLTAAWDANQFEVKAYWAKIEADSPLRMVDAYASALEVPARDTDYAWDLGRLLSDTGHPEEAFSLQRYLVDHFRQTGDRENLQGCLGNQAFFFYTRGELDEAMLLHKEQERICRELGNKDGLQACLGNQALIHKDRGEVDEAMRLHKEQERICRELGNKGGLSSGLGQQAGIFFARGELDEAMRLNKEQECICRELGNKDGLSSSLGKQAGIFFARGDMGESMRLNKEQERICRELGDKDGLQACLGNQALIFKARGELDEAMRLNKEEERICRELGNKDGLSSSLGQQAGIFFARGELDEAMRLLKEQERICRELGNKNGLSTNLGNQANIFFVRGELDEPMRLLKEQERICRELGNKDGLSTSLGNQANVFFAKGELDEAMRLFKEQEHICRELGNKDGLSSSLGNQANIFYASGDLDTAMRLYKDVERICRELGNKDGLARSLISQAFLLAHKMGQPQEALPLAEEAYLLATQHGLVALARQIEPILKSSRSQAR
ncbi:MAG: tetratricopeptide repeat protein [Pyrinomonadaceae bacterium]